MSDVIPDCNWNQSHTLQWPSTQYYQLQDELQLRKPVGIAVWLTPEWH